MSDKRPVFQDANGVGWCMSASYNPFLQRVLLCTEHGMSKMGGRTRVYEWLQLRALRRFDGVAAVSRPIAPWMILPRSVTTSYVS